MGDAPDAKASTRSQRKRRARLVRATALLLGAAPALGLLVRALADAGIAAFASLPGLGEGLGANPVEAVTHTTGESALRLLIATLAVTPLRRLLGWSWLAPERRTFGLFAFGYALAHFATYLALDLGFAFSLLAEDLAERPWILVGFAALCALVPLAVTSTRGWMKQLGAKRWQRLHQLVYPATALALLHFFWLVKADLREPAIHAGVLAVLLAARALPARRAH